MNSDPDDFPADNSDSSDEESQTESKSQRKRDAHQITELAAQLVAMKPKPLARLPIEQNILDAITHCAEIKAHGARKRQLHFVSKLLRESGKASELISLLATADQKKNTDTENPHLPFRDQLIDNFSDHVDALRENYPHLDLQQVRQLVRNAHNESKKALTKVDATEGATQPAITKAPKNTKAGKSLLKLLSANS